MKSLIFSTNSTNTALVTVKNLLPFKIIIVERTNLTVVACEVNCALDARFRFWLLFLTSQTFYHSYFVSFKLMVNLRIELILIHYLIMTKSTAPIFSFTNFIWTLLLASSTIMFATKLFWLLGCILFTFDLFLFILALFFFAFPVLI